jgi:hypothetical protein
MVRHWGESIELKHDSGRLYVLLAQEPLRARLLIVERRQFARGATGVLRHIK